MSRPSAGGVIEAPERIDVTEARLGASLWKGFGALKWLIFV